jgi:hypothetical protein
MDCIIYKIIDNTNDNLYIGSTTLSLKKRLNNHKCKNDCSSYQIIENGDYIIAEIEKCDVENRRYREQYWIDNTDCINKYRAYRTKEQRKEQKMKYNEKNKDKRREYDKKYHEKNKDKRREYAKNIYHYQNSWGGHKRNNNNLLEIDVNLLR